MTELPPMLFADPASWPRPVKKALFLALDAALIPISLYIAFALRLGTWQPFSYASVSTEYFAAVGAVGVLLLVGFQNYKLKLHAFDQHTMVRIGGFAISLVITGVSVGYFFNLWAPRSVPVIFGAVYYFAAVGARLGVLTTFRWIHSVGGAGGVPVAIYGAGAAGMQLATALSRSREMRPVVFVDDNPALHGLIIGGLKVCHPDRLAMMARSGQIARVLIAITSLSATQRNNLISSLEQLPLEVQSIPSLVDLASGRRGIGDLRPASPDALLGRNKVDLDVPEVAKTYAGRCVMVTGAGGSIGAELCRQLLDCGPSHIVLFERSEHALYEIDRVLRPAAEQAGIQLTARLGSVIDRPTVEATLRTARVDVIMHAAAYKHVPLIEDNELEAARNNVIGTRIVAEAARDAGIERFVLISTDKAVRPTNIMGATKRMAELVVQDIQTRCDRTRFSMVRFGNVLGSSGSVVPLFQQQIQAGGPVTITHRDVIRYFMTIPEAARLVLLAGAFSEGGDLFALDMGEPVKIVDLARRMIELSGRTVRDAENPEGDIEFEFVGLRPGEKLFEELLIDHDSVSPTPHDKILYAQEGSLSEIETAAMLRKIERSLAERDPLLLRQAVGRWVDGYSDRRSTVVSAPAG